MSNLMHKIKWVTTSSQFTGKLCTDSLAHAPEQQQILGQDQDFWAPPIASLHQCLQGQRAGFKLQRLKLRRSIAAPGLQSHLWCIPGIVTDLCDMDHGKYCFSIKQPAANSMHGLQIVHRPSQTSHVSWMFTMDWKTGGNPFQGCLPCQPPVFGLHTS
jgi:hypothetical protein